MFVEIRIIHTDVTLHSYRIDPDTACLEVLDKADDGGALARLVHVVVVVVEFYIRVSLMGTLESPWDEFFSEYLVELAVTVTAVFEDGFVHDIPSVNLALVACDNGGDMLFHPILEGLCIDKFAVLIHFGEEIAEFGLDQLSIDKLGLDLTDRRILETIADKFLGGPVGLETLAACTGEDAGTIEDVYEPFLMQCGFIAKTPRGRVLAPMGWNHLGRACPADIEKKLSGLGVTSKEKPNGQISIDDIMNETDDSDGIQI